MPRFARWNFFAEGMNTVFSGVFIGIIGPFTLPLAVRMGATPWQVFIITAIPFIANLLSPIWAHLQQGKQKKWWVVVPHIFWRAGMGLLGFFKNPAAITAMQATTNLGLSANATAYGPLMQKVYPAEIRGRLMGYVRLILAAFMLPTTLIAGRVIDKHGPQWLFLVGGICALIGLGFFALIKEPPETVAIRAKRGSALEGLKLAVADQKFRRFLLAAFLFHGGVLTAVPLYSVFQVREMGLTNTQISYISLCWNIAWLISFAVWGRLVDQKGARPVVIAAAAFYLGGPLAYGLVGGFFPLILVAAMCTGIADAAMDMGSLNLILAENPSRVGPYTAANLVVSGIRGLLGPLLGSWMLSAFGFRPTFLTAAVLVAAGLAVLVWPDRGRSAQAQLTAASR